MKCFLSHSSKDKKSYVELVADRLLPNIAYDAITFEEGMETLEEILRGIAVSDLFVLFISEHSLTSEWVKKEITEARRGLDTGSIRRFFPLVIDQSIKHSDKRIPDWVRENYNLRPISKPTIAVRRIRQRMIELSWAQHPTTKKKHEVFVGRNDILSDCEQRFDDFKKGKPLVFFASGLRGVGRKTTILKALQKSNIVRESYEPIRIVMGEDDGLDEFILRLTDTGLCEARAAIDFLNTPIEKKILRASQLLGDIQRSKEVLLIEDVRCIVKFDGIISPWFLSAVERTAQSDVLIGVAPYFRPRAHQHLKNPKLFFANIPELDAADRVGLFGRYCRIHEVDLTSEQTVRFSALLTGYPEQVAYAVDLIASAGVDQAWKESSEIVGFSSFRAAKYIERYASNQRQLEFLRFIASFDFVSLAFIDEIANSVDQPLLQFLEEFIGHSICERIGVAGEYVRLNDIVRDYVNRADFELHSSYAKALRAFTERFFLTYEKDDFDMSEYYISLKEALEQGKALPDNLLTPSHFIRSMKDLYNRGTPQAYQQIVRLANRVLQKSNSYDDATEQNIRYYLCQSLARLRDRKFLSEVQGIKGPEHTFLIGFYYRLQERYDEAAEKFKISMGDKRTDQRSRRELVLAYVAQERYDEALQIAKENYEKYPANPLLIQAYFECLLNQKRDVVDAVTMERLLEDLRKIGTEKSERIFAALESKFYLVGRQDPARAIQLAEDAAAKFPDDIYMVVSKIDIGIRLMNKDLLSKAFVDFETYSGGKSAAKGIVSKGRAYLAALQGRKSEAFSIVERDLKWMRESTMNEMRNVITRA